MVNKSKNFGSLHKENPQNCWHLGIWIFKSVQSPVKKKYLKFLKTSISKLWIIEARQSNNRKLSVQFCLFVSKLHLTPPPSSPNTELLIQIEHQSNIIAALDKCQVTLQCSIAEDHKAAINTDHQFNYSLQTQWAADIYSHFSFCIQSFSFVFFPHLCGGQRV